MNLLYNRYTGVRKSSKTNLLMDGDIPSRSSFPITGRYSSGGKQSRLHTDTSTVPSGGPIEL